MHFLTDIFILVYLSFNKKKSRRVHLCAGLTAASWIMEPFGEIGTRLLKVVIKKVIAENQCVNVKLEFNILAIPCRFCFHVWILNIPVNNFSVMSGFSELNQTPRL